jgi:hexosaminidase
MDLHNMTKVIELLQYFELDLLSYVIHSNGKRPIIWQDLFDMQIQGIPSNVILDIWKEWIMESSLYTATNANYDVIFSACWYLDHLNEDWWSFYTCNPRNMANLTSMQQSHVLGGHTSMWGESVDSTDFFVRVWPRSSATAEVLWSGSPINSLSHHSHVQARLEQFRCHMLRLVNVPISPITPGHCEAHGPTDSKQSAIKLDDLLQTT